MCGLAGRFSASGLPAAAGWAERADTLLAHRGPDGRGYHGDERCELVHRRLALIDLSPTGAQPMANADGSVLVVYNGEIYNHRELRDELIAHGHAFRGTSDTEVLAHLYELHGERMAERLRGIFAFALYDRRASRLLLVRDRFGVKPLFYAALGDQLVFASEMKAILALPGFRPSVDRQAVYDFLGLGYVPEPATGFVEIRALPKGTVLRADASGVTCRRYHELRAAPDPTLGLAETVDAAGEALTRAVAAQAVADVPVAALLSGGIDSSLVVAAHCRSASAVSTFNVRFPDGAYDETGPALAVARHYGTRHQTIDLDARALDPDAVFDLFRHFDQPFADPSLIPTYWISRAIRERGIICTLSGDGGDEAFGGYARFWRTNRLVRLMSAPAWTRSALAWAGRRAESWSRDWGRQAAKAVWLAESGRTHSAGLIAGLSNYLSEEQKRRLVPQEVAAGLLPSERLFGTHEPSGVSDIEELSRRVTEALFEVSLPSDMLRKVDMMSMRASIEVRVPMLDESLVALGLTLPHRLKTDGRSGKRVLRALARRWLPEWVARHPKHGFGIPIDVMATPRLHAALDDVLLGPGARTREWLQPALVREWLGAFRAAGGGSAGGGISRGGLYQRVLIVLALELWLRDRGVQC
jgi:asparagine synthase (glutamine-hydrolysing)